MRAFALTVPGLGPILVEEARALGLPAGAVEHDGRADVVPFADATPGALARLRTAERTFAEVDHARIGNIDVAARRVVVRLRTEHGITRSRLRDVLTDDRAPTPELWVLQTSGHRARIGRPIHRGSTAAPRPGALRPAVAAAMVHVLGRPGALLDPCCGTGAIVDAAHGAGWRAVGGDVERLGALALDARRLPFVTDAFDAVAANLPFGNRYVVQGTPVAWYRRALQEALRVAPRAAVLSPPSTPFRQALGRVRADLVGRHDLVLLGRAATIWVLRRAGAPAR